MTDWAAYYEEPLRAYLAAHGLTPSPAWRTDAMHRELDLRPFKRAQIQPRIRAALGVLKGYRIDRMLDIGSGRGAFLWPALEQLRTTAFTVVERSRSAGSMFAQVRRGGLQRLAAIVGDAEHLCLQDGAFEVATMLEVLEHLHHPDLAARELARVTRSLAVVSVPAQPDDNPEHLRWYDASSFADLLRGAGFNKVRVEPHGGAWLAIAQR